MQMIYLLFPKPHSYFESWEAGGGGGDLDGRAIDCLLYADDLLIVSQTAQLLRKLGGGGGGGGGGGLPA